jgi:hypothetical protein
VPPVGPLPRLAGCVTQTELLQVGGVRVGIGGFVLLLATATGVAVGLSAVQFTVLLVVVTCAGAVHARRSGALLLGVTGWALCTGFGVNELGQLTFTEPDVLRLWVYVGCALILGGRLPAQ